MIRRASLPGIDELFRSSKETPPEPAPASEVAESTKSQVENSPPEEASAAAASSADLQPGRKAPRHEEKVTFYCTGDDLTRIERVRLALRSEHRLASDRGRIVRAALAEILDDFEKNGDASALVIRLRNQERT